MKQGKVNTYLNERLAALLDAHGPESDAESDRGLADKLNYIIPGWDAVLRDEKKRWRASLSDQEWIVVQSCTMSHAFAMECGGPVEQDIGAILMCAEDTLDSELAMDDAAIWRASTIKKLRGATVASDLALVWMLIRERIRAAK